jgi:hypothetical protein
MRGIAIYDEKHLSQKTGRMNHEKGDSIGLTCDLSHDNLVFGNRATDKNFTGSGQWLFLAK